MSRKYCSVCARAESTCVCQWVQPQSNQTPVLILQHTDETKKALGTARLVEQGLYNAKVLSHTTFLKHECLAALNQFEATNPCLLYARKTDERIPHIDLDLNHKKPLSKRQAASFDSIILLDGTWRNTREILHKNEWLSFLPTIALKNVGESRYRIRKAAQKDALATIEAVSTLLSVLDVQFNQHAFLKPFEKMIDLQIAKMGNAVYQRNYLA